MSRLARIRVLPFLFEDRRVIEAVDGLVGYVWRVSSWHQVGVCLVAVSVATLGLVPIELHRRIVNSLVDREGVEALVNLCLVYLATIAAAQTLNWLLKIYQSWITQSATYRTRRALLDLAARDDKNRQLGQSVSIVSIESEKLAGFVGNQISQASANVAILLGVVGYMFIVAPKIAMFSLVFLAPQILITPVVQNWLNRLVGRHISLMRGLGDAVLRRSSGNAAGDHLAFRIFRNRLLFDVVKSTMKAALNLINELAPVVVFLWGGYLVLQGQEEVGTLVAFVSGYQRLASPTRELIQFYRVVAQTSVQHEMVTKWSTERRA